MSLDKKIPLWNDLPGGPSAMKPYGIKIGYDLSQDISNEPLVDLKSLGLLTRSWYAVSDGTNPPYNRPIDGAIEEVYLRQTAAQMCVTADKLAQEKGFRLLFVDGFRSRETQQGLYRHFESVIKERKPHLTQEQLAQETLVYVSPGNIHPEKPETWFVHATGGSIDVLPYDSDNDEILDCGVGFDNDTPLVFTDHYERNDPNTAAAQNRRLLHNAMISAGFTNYPYEYFHFDYGTIIHSVRKKIENPASMIKAFYGLAGL